MERRQPGQEGPATRPASPVRKNPNLATKSPRETYPQGSPRGGENEHPTQMDNQATTHANGQPTTNDVCICSKSCKNPRGPKIHQTKMGCLVNAQPEQRSRNSLRETQEEPGRESTHSAQNPHAPEDLGEMQEVPGQESPHRAQNLHAQDAQAPGIPQHQQRGKWPPASKESEWRQFDDDVDSILEATMKGGADRKLQTMATMIISIATERFGLVEKRAATNQYSKNCRAEKISQLRQEL